MAEPILFPNITDDLLVPLRALRILARQDPHILDDPRCPYTVEQKRVLSQMIFGGEGGGGGEANPYDSNRLTFLDEDGDREDIMARQIALALDDIQRMQNNLTKVDQKDQIAFLKAKPGLIEKLVEMNDKNRGQKALGDFMKKIYQFVDDEMTVDQRTLLIKKIGAYINTDPQD
jgi:hypothetical protein